VELFIFLVIAVVIYLYFKNDQTEKFSETKIKNINQINKNYSSKFNKTRNYGKYRNEHSITSLIDKNEELIKFALEKNKNIKFNYVDRNKDATSRAVTPLKLFLYHFDDDGEMICLEAHCHLRNAKRTFALFRMSSVTII
jgi:hypothetical protein